MVAICCILSLLWFGYSWFSAQSSIQQTREQLQQLHRQLDQAYQQQSDLFPLQPDTQGLSLESQEIESRALQEFRIRHNQTYARQLSIELLPRYRDLWHSSYEENDHATLIGLLNTIIRLYSHEDERRVFRQELLSLQGIDPKTLDTPATVLFRIIPTHAQSYLYRFIEYPDGQHRLIPVDPKTGKDISLSRNTQTQITAKFNLLRAQNLFWEAGMQFLNQNFVVAHNTLLRCIELAPTYLEPYFLLCCLYRHPNAAKFPGNAYELWRQRALEVIAKSALSQAQKQELGNKFSPEIVQRCSQVYSMLPQRSYLDKIDYLVQVTAASIKNSLQLKDCIIKIDDTPIFSIEALLSTARHKQQTACTILRGWEFLDLTISANELAESEFQVVEIPPFFLIYQNQALPTHNLVEYAAIQPYDLGLERSEFQSSQNEIFLDTMVLGPGSYVIFSSSPGYFSVRYPFTVHRERFFGKPFANPILLHLPPCSAEIEEFLESFTLIPRPFITEEPNAQNKMGILLGSCEVTVGDWITYLKSVHGPLPWKMEKLSGKLPMLASNKPLLYLRGGELLLRTGNLEWPVIGVTYQQVQDYIAWRNQNLPEYLQKRRFKFRLPTAQEWMIASQGSDARKYPWGNTSNPKFCKVAESRPYWAELEPIYRYNTAFLSDESPFGVHDMAGNVTEYTSSSKTVGTSTLYIVKGASWNDPSLLDAERENYVAANVYRNNRGFRLCAGSDPLYEITADSEK